MNTHSPQAFAQYTGSIPSSYSTQSHPKISIPSSQIPQNCTHLNLSHHPHEYIGVSYPLPETLRDIDFTNCRLKGICNMEGLQNLEELTLRKNAIGWNGVDDEGEETSSEDQDTQAPEDTKGRMQTVSGEESNRTEEQQEEQQITNANQEESTSSSVIQYNGDDWAKGLTSLQKLKILDLYDNEIDFIPTELNELKSLEKLDLSFNKIRSIKPLDGRKLVNLRQLYLVNNKIKKMIDFSHFQKMHLLEMGANRIREIRGLENGGPCETLTELWLGKNKIADISGLHKLKNLKTLSLQSNRLTKISGLENLRNLEQLLLSENDIEEVTGLDNLTKLKLLDLSYNKRLSTIHGIDNLSNLEELWFSANSIQDYDELKKLTAYPKLNDVYLQGNPLSRDPQYRRKVLLMIPNLENIDGFPVALMKERVLPGRMQMM
uniref:Protein phosphatase 1 regulatory subunit 7 n=1 Tax=Percolomonas cosmopolitus TaxID=63605 RepID=A0A7S1PG35_9EUKA